MIGSALFIFYAIGQFINGQLGDKFGARKLITLGIAVSAVMNIIFGFSRTLTAMAIIWGVNGYFQSMGWSPSIKTLANWFPTKERGRISGIYGSSFQIGNVVSWLLAGFLCSNYGWRSVFWLPAILFIFCGIFFFARCRNSPEDIGFLPIEEHEKTSESQLQGSSGPNPDKHLGFAFTIRQTVGNPRMWCVGLAYLSLGLVSYGFLYWIPTYMSEVQGITMSRVASNAIVVPLAGSLGALTAGWATDKFFKSRRAPVVILMCFLTCIFLLIYPRVPCGILSLLSLAAIGFTTFGAAITIVTAIPMDYGTRKAASSTAGFIDSLGYVGATIAGVGAGWLIDNYGWDYAFYFWASGALIACIPMLPLWRYMPPRGKYM